MRITSRDNPRVRELLKLTSSARERRRRALAVLDGTHLIAAAAARGLGAELLCASDSGLRRAEVRHLFDTCPARARVIVADRLFDEISALASPSGILAVIPVLDTGRLPEALHDAVVLEGIQDAGNVGTILRTAAATGVRHLVACAGGAFLWSPKVVRAAMGAHFHLSLHECADVGAVVQRAAGAIVTTSGKAARSVFELDLRGPTIWIFGNEGAGVSPAALAAASVTAHVPMAAGIESLNVATTAAVCLYEQWRQRHLKIRGAPA